MHKCQNCGTEFDTKFCPNCGTPASKKAASPALVKFCSFLPYVVSALFALFSALLFLMCLGQVSTVMGMGTGSIYDYLSIGSGTFGGDFGLLGDMGGSDMGATYNVCAALVSFGAIGAVLAGVGLIFRCNVPLRVKRLGNVRICTISEACMFVIYFVDFLLACILCGSVSDEITAPGAGPVCVLLFSLLFALCSAGAKIVQKFLPRISPSAAAELAKRKAKCRASMGMPVPPEGLEEKPQKPMYQGADCSEALRAKIVKYAKAKKILVILAGIMFAIIWFVCVFLWTFSDLRYISSLTYEHLDSLIKFVLIPIPCIGTFATAILGGIRGSIYYKKNDPNFFWQRKHVWSDAWMFWALLIYCSTCIVAEILAVIILISVNGEIVTSLIPIPFIIVYCIVVFSCAGAIARKGRKLSLAVYGVERPWKAPAVQEKYQNDMKDYRLQKKLYRVQRREEKVYLRKLAYYEEGAKYHA